MNGPAVRSPYSGHVTSGYCYFCDAPADGDVCEMCGRPVTAVDEMRRPSRLRTWLSGDGPALMALSRRQAVAGAILLGLLIYLVVFRVRWGVS